MIGTVWKVLTRKKILDPVSAEQSELGRVLNTFDLTALGVGSTLGVGVYVIAGQVAKETAGPAVVLSFLIATVASVFAGLCYAEFGARAPRAGSAYIYSYVCVGEFIAFVIGWNLILEYVIGSASVARGLSLYLDTLINDTLKDTFIDIAPINVNFMSSYFDFFAFGISVLLATALAFGLKESSWVNNIFTLVNLAVVIFVVVAGATKSNTENWDLPKPNATDQGEGGFFPFGVEGMIKGAATCFYGFVGFDCIATTGEEVKNPKKAIPLAIVLSLSVIFLAYFGTSTVITLMVPYYSQDKNAPLPHAFAMVGLDWAKWVVAIGGIFGLCASLFGAMFPLPRIIYAMASDSLVFKFLGKVSERFKTPVVGTLLAGVLTGLMAALFDLKQLVNMMSIGTLLAYTIVAASVLLLRYEIEKSDYEPLLRSMSDSEESETYTDNQGLDVAGSSDDLDMMTIGSGGGILKQIFNCGRHNFPSETSEKIVKFEVCLYCFLCVLIGLCAMYFKDPISEGRIYAIVLTSIVVGLAVLVVMSITTQPKSRKELSFKVPLVPLIPALSILVNVYLMLMLDVNTWIRFGVWMAVGLPIYYFSVKTHSETKNESIRSRESLTKEKLNGYVNHSYVIDEPPPTLGDGPKKNQAPQPPPPTLEKIEATIADLDEILENAEADILDRKFSVDSISTVLREENVQADVHRSDVPVTPIQEAPPLLQSGDVQTPLPSDVATSPDAAIEQSGEGEASPDAAIEQTGEREVSPDAAIEQTGEGEASPDAAIEQTGEGEASPDAAIEQTGEGEAPPDTEVDSPDSPAIPPPPPMMNQIEDVEVVIPRPLVRLSALTNAKLKPVPETPPVDYSRQNSTVPENDNLKFGTQEYKEFLEKLDQTLQVGYTPTQIVVDLKKKPEPSKTPPVHNEDVLDDNIDRDEARKKLAQFLERTNSLPLFGLQNNGPNGYSKWKNMKKNEEEEKDYKEQHRQNMQNIFRSVRLKKEDSFKEDSDNKKSRMSATPISERKVYSDDNNLDRLRHKENMNNIFRSIKLRKKDSFRSNESQ